MEEQMTLEQVLEVTNELLGNILIPVSMKHVTDEINHARDNLQMCIDAIRKNNGKNKEDE